MKFRISGKDLIMFGVFAAMLLYLCAIITGNINTLSVYGHFSGLSPFPGLSTQLPVTLILFVIFLVIIFSGVSSYIFERKSGIGFEISNKDDKGYSRWSKEREMKSDKGVEEVDPLATDSQYAGIPLVNDGIHLFYVLEIFIENKANNNVRVIRMDKTERNKKFEKICMKSQPDLKEYLPAAAEMGQLGCNLNLRRVERLAREFLELVQPARIGYLYFVCRQLLTLYARVRLICRAAARRHRLRLTAKTVRDAHPFTVPEREHF